MVWNIVPVGSIPVNNNKSIIFLSSHIVSFRPTSFLFVPHRFLSSHFNSFISIRLTSFPFVPFVSFHPTSFPFISLSFYSTSFPFVLLHFHFFLFPFIPF